MKCWEGTRPRVDFAFSRPAGRHGPRGVPGLHAARRRGWGGWGGLGVGGEFRGVGGSWGWGGSLGELGGVGGSWGEFRGVGGVGGSWGPDEYLDEVGGGYKNGEKPPNCRASTTVTGQLAFQPDYLWSSGRAGSLDRLRLCACRAGESCWTRAGAGALSLWRIVSEHSPFLFSSCLSALLGLSFSAAMHVLDSEIVRPCLLSHAREVEAGFFPCRRRRQPL